MALMTIQLINHLNIAYPIKIPVVNKVQVKGNHKVKIPFHAKLTMVIQVILYLSLMFPKTLRNNSQRFIFSQQEQLSQREIIKLNTK